MSRVRSPFPAVLMFAVALVVGCRSGVERDVVQREMRQQEDEIYALEDYLSEYQQLLCDARSENAQLKRQMVQGQFRDDDASKRSGRSDALRSPSTAPTRPPGTRAPTVIPPEVPPLDLSEPAVPPLDDQSATEPAGLDCEIQPAAAEVEVVGQPATEVVLRGEVRLERDDRERGPRVLVDVEPVDSAGQLAEFRGRLSLLVLDPAAREKEQQLARWDFEADDLQAMAKLVERGTSFEFPLQLPADAPTNRPLELWVRLVPEDGEKLLGRTTMDLSRAGRFASAEVKPKRQERRAVHVAAAEMPIEPRRQRAIRKMDRDVEQSGWQTARPGEVAKPQAAAAKAATEWKLATRPVPEVESTPIVASRPVRDYLPPSVEGDRYGAGGAPEWSPERPEDDEAQSPQEPAWSPTR